MNIEMIKKDLQHIKEIGQNYLFILQVLNEKIDYTSEIDDITLDDIKEIQTRYNEYIAQDEYNIYSDEFIELIEKEGNK